MITESFSLGFGMARGDAFPRRFRIFNLGGIYVTKAYLMFKPTLTTGDGSATISKTISTSNVSGTGQIEDTGQTSDTAVLRFDITYTDSAALTAGTQYYWGTEVFFSDGQILHLWQGSETPTERIVQATS